MGAFGRNSHSGTLSASPFGKALQARRLNLAEDLPPLNAHDLGPVPYVFVGDEGFPLKPHLVQPFPGCQLSRQQRIFNYRLSRARQMVECTLGSWQRRGGLTTYFLKCLQTLINCQSQKSSQIVFFKSNAQSNTGSF